MVKYVLGKYLTILCLSLLSVLSGAPHSVEEQQGGDDGVHLQGQEQQLQGEDEGCDWDKPGLCTHHCILVCAGYTYL